MSASAYYQRATGQRSARAVEDERLLGVIGELHAANYGKFGGTASIESFTEQRWVTIQHSGRRTYPF